MGGVVLMHLMINIMALLAIIALLALGAIFIQSAAVRTLLYFWIVCHALLVLLAICFAFQRRTEGSGIYAINAPP